MTSVYAKSPADLVITPRDRRFGRNSTQARWWAGGDPIATAFYNALSVTFPRGEAMFIESVKAFRDNVPEKLDGEIRAFITQEVMHSREHVSFNKRVTDAGYDIAALDQDVSDVLELARQQPPIVNLGATMALEHYTAIMAVQFLEDPSTFAGTDPEQADMWRWHAIEEIEHKGVAFDTFMHAARNWSAAKRWRFRALTMLLVSTRFWPHRIKGMLNLLRQDGLSGPRVWARIAWFLLGKPGVLRKLFVPWLAYFRPGFHPWDHDDRALIATVDSAYADARPAAAQAA